MRVNNLDTDNDSKHGTAGGRHLRLLTGQQGGPSLDNCTTLELSPIAPFGLLTSDQYFELRQLRIPPVYLEIAINIGYDQFLLIWHLLENYSTETNNHRLYIPKFSTFVRLQSKLLVQSLLALNYSYDQIIKEVEASLGVKINKKRIKNIKYEL